MNTIKTLALALLMMCGISTAVQAGSITGFGTTSYPGSSTGTIGPVGSTPAINNDNTTAPSPNVIPYSIFFNSNGTLDVEFDVSNSGGVTEYTFTQTLFNNSGLAWEGFRFELGYGVGSSFVPSSLLDSLDFDAPDFEPAPLSSAFTTLSLSTDSLVWYSGTVPSIGVGIFSFAVDVPDNLSAFNPSGLNRFTLRQVPAVSPTAAVPEPTAMIFLATGLAGVGAATRLRKRKHD